MKMKMPKMPMPKATPKVHMPKVVGPKAKLSKVVSAWKKHEQYDY